MTWLATKLATTPANIDASKRVPEQRDAIRRDRLRRDARRVDHPKLRATRVLYVHAHAGGLAPPQQTLVGLLLDVVVAVELRIFLLDLRHQLRLRLELGILTPVTGQLGASRRHGRLGIRQ